MSPEKRALSPGRSLIVSGPASWKVVKGAVEVFKAEFRSPSRLIVRAGKTLPVTALEPSELSLALGENGSVDELGSDPFPEAWRAALSQLVSLRARSVALLGDTDSGKTTFCIMLANAALREGFRVAFLDGDIGQAELGPPTTVSLAFLRKPVADLFPLSRDRAYFVGATTPAALSSRSVAALENLHRSAEGEHPDLAVLNLDGWVEGPAAIEHKAEIVRRLRPQVCVMLQPPGDLHGLVEALKPLGCQVLALPVPPSIRKRSSEERRKLRQLGYRKELKGSTRRTLQLDEVRFLGGAFTGGTPLGQERVEGLSELLGRRVLYGEETVNGVTVVADEHKPSPRDQPGPSAGSTANVKVVPVGFERGLIAGLLAKNGQLLSLGIVEELNYAGRAVRVLTPYRGPVDTVELGQVRLDRCCRELPWPPASSRRL